MPRKFPCLFFAVAVGMAVATQSIDGKAQAPEKAQTAEPPAKATTTGNKPTYPRVNLAPAYEVDPAWPQKPADFRWEAMPGIAVDQRDNVWIFTRSQPP